jgi:tellurite methyltransferase
MRANHSVRFFDEQFRRQVATGEFALNPFETAALPFLHGRVLDYGCGLGNLAISAARGGCEVQALDASPAAIAHLREVAARERLAIDARDADLRDHVIDGAFDTVVCIGLLMFFDCDAATRQLAQLQAHTRPGGIVVLNVLITGTTYLGMFVPDGHCLFDADALRARFTGWTTQYDAIETFPAPGDTQKVFLTLIARKAVSA